MIEENTHKSVAPTIDRLLDRFDRGFLNPSAPTKELLSALKPLFDAVKDLKPYKDGEAKSIWVVVPRGDISDYGDYEEWKEYGDVSSFEEFESLWKEKYPTESVWYELFLSEGEDYR